MVNSRANYSFKEAVGMPFSTISKKIICEKLLPLSPLTALPNYVPISLSYYEVPSFDFPQTWL